MDLVLRLVAMKMVGHRFYQTTYTHLKEDSLKKAAADMATVFKKKKEAKQVKKAAIGDSPWERDTNIERNDE